MSPRWKTRSSAPILNGQIARAQQAIADALKQDPNDPVTQALHNLIGEIASGARPQPKTVRDLERE